MIIRRIVVTAFKVFGLFKKTHSVEFAQKGYVRDRVIEIDEEHARLLREKQDLVDYALLARDRRDARIPKGE